MTSYLYILGRTPELSFLELKTFIPDVSLLSVGVATSASTIPIEKLGGTIKIAEKVGIITDISPETLVPFFDTTHGRFSFGVSVYGGMQKISREMLENMKQLLESRGVSVRFVESRDGATLSSVVVEKNQLQELLVIKTDSGFIIGKTIAVQPFDDWGKRDFGRPNADVKAGMLPPKVSRMIVNIADRERNVEKLLAQKTLLDPFCGMGTILSEALVMGWNVVGSDVDADVVTRARANIRWLTENKIAAEGVTCRLNVADAVHVSETVDHNTIDAIVTEPYMGPTEIASGKKGLEQLKNIVKGLEKLYIGCLRDWNLVLKPNGLVLIALPRYEVASKTYFVKKVIDKCEMLGYTILTGPIEYGRPQATVKRLFYVLQKK